ncbi:LLM class flavin-dependent oxidoreductase [Novosphingobium mangrovi (ex Hu et al. 2023)]|uniref:LLM class flavin-dependent oxidoreductase n=1 Tax=Novosphingobium mangrovi (ex Hu et al. 2023) TaxID=2930094 RepID=A0ABT0AG08_9SPHN|nr:LLM class flavin-dependent oxidoreductase [Novosphingobium mangrovi (ex Hu et al. 2023)]MCJ1962133.1 LLM class flavin-dependent oxidoreductase [Novosphingobium mangrovi (ex Hu et al. 2023)]
MTRKMHLVGILATSPTIHHSGAWRHPASQNRITDPNWWADLAREYESACYDGVFFGDSPIIDTSERTARGGQAAYLDPSPLAMVMAGATKHLGIGITISTSLIPPYAIARSLQTMNVLTGGRIAWNIVTSTGKKEAECFGMDDLLPRNERYDMADEVVEACCKLWDSFGEGALLADKESGIYVDTDKLTDFDYTGKYVRTKGPLPVPPSAQGRPVLMQAGASERGRNFAARWAEMIFTLQNDLPEMQAFYADVKGRITKEGRDPADCAILAAVDPIVGETKAIALEKQRYVNNLVDDDMAIAHASRHLGVDLNQFPMDKPLEDLDIENGTVGSFEVMRNASKSKGLTLIELCRSFSISESCPQLAGTPEQVADAMCEMFEKKGCDGFIISPAAMPGSIEEFNRMVVPILQERGLFRTAYEGTTLRASLKAS